MEQRKTPWEILGIPENSTDDIAKSAWKKLVIKCHPDKVAEELKAEKEEEFKQVNEAFKTITDPELRKAFDEAQELRQRLRETGAPRFNATPSRSYNTRTAAPPTFTRAETFDYGRFHEDERFYPEQRTSSRKYEGYEPQPTTPKYTSRSHRSERERRANDEKATRSDRRRTRDRDEKRDRATKFAPYVEDDSDDFGQYEESYHRRSEEHRVRDKYVDEGRRRDDGKKHTRSHSDKYDGPTYKYDELTGDAKDYMSQQRHRYRPEVDRVFVRRGSGVPEESTVRRSSARRESGRSSGRKDRDPERERSRTHKPSIEVVDFPPTERRPPSFQHSASSPSGIKVTRIAAQRMSSDYERDDAARPSLRRSETSPPLPHLNVSTSSRRKDSIPSHGSKLRSSENIVEGDSGYSSPTTPDQAGNAHANAGATSTKYYYPTATAANLDEDDDASTVTATPYRTVLREPDSNDPRRGSTSPVRHTVNTTRPAAVRYTSASANNSPSTPRSASYVYTTVEPRSSDEAMRSSRPGLRHSHTTAPPSVRRSPERELQREVREELLRPSGSHSKGGSGGSFPVDKVAFQKKVTRDNVNYGPYERSSRGNKAEYIRPTMAPRTATYAQ